MSEVKVGKTVRHKSHGFEGVVKEISKNASLATVVILKGENPFKAGDSNYIAVINSLEVVEPVNTFDKMLQDMRAEAYNTDTNSETEEVVEVDSNGTVNLEMPDGTKILFKFYNDFVNYVKEAQTL